MKKSILNNLLTLCLLSVFLFSCSDNNELINLKEEQSEILTNDLTELKSILLEYKKELSSKNIDIVSEKGVNLLHTKLGFDNNFNKRTNERELTSREKSIIKNLSISLSNSYSPENALSILDDYKNDVNNNNTLADFEKEFLTTFILSTKESTKFVIEEFNNQINSGKYSNKARMQLRRSWWGCLKKAYADLTDDFVGTMAVAIFPGPCCAAIVIGGTANYLMQ